MREDKAVAWFDHKRAPSCPANPAYPAGIDVDASAGAAAACAVNLPYPAKRCGLYVVRCGTCGQRTAVTTAGRRDDPRSVKIACRLVKGGH